MAAYTIYIFLTICISALVFGFPNADVLDRVARGGLRSRCLTKNGSGGVCLPYQRCSLEIKRREDAPSVCGWDTFGPIVCCPIKEPASEQTEKIKALTCGRPISQSPEPRLDEGTILVRGGEDAKPGKWPWMALIFLEEDVERKLPICGASLISEQTLLTAAHCFLGRPNGNLVVRLGEHNLAISSKHSPVEIKVKKIVTHSSFRYPSLHNDIAILHLESKVKLTNMIQLICLPKGHERRTFVGETATVTGWGHLDFGGDRADTLQQLELPIITNEQCQKKYDTLQGAKVNLPRGIINSMMCAGFENERKDACQGDSGGPLVLRTKANNWIQVGIVSAGFQCGAGIPGLYTRVTAYLDWIAVNTI